MAEPRFSMTADEDLPRTLRREKEARERLIEIYDGFTEGHDTRDLKEARELLERL